jgi:2-aminoadipate transaminase
MREPLPRTQNDLRPGMIELAFGEPDPTLLPVDLVAASAAHVMDEFGPGAIAYGRRSGPLALRRAIAARIADREGRDVPDSGVYITGGSSQALDLILTVFTVPGDLVLVETPTYSLALGTMRDHPVEIAGVGHDADGLDVTALEATLDRLTSAGRPARLLYTIPTFHNPTGACLADRRRARLLALATRHDLLVVEDDVYRELAYDRAAPQALWASDPAAPVMRLGSFSKALAPGLRVGWVNARPDLLARLDAAGVLDSGGGVSHFAACVVALALTSGAYDDHVARLRRTYASRRDALGDALRAYLPAGSSFAVPAGGFFIWVELPHGVRAAELLPVAEEHGVSFAPGRRFCCDGDDGDVRLSFSLYDEAQLAEGARRLGAALRARRSG